MNKDYNHHHSISKQAPNKLIAECCTIFFHNSMPKQHDIDFEDKNIFC